MCELNPSGKGTSSGCRCGSGSNSLIGEACRDAEVSHVSAIASRVINKVGTKGRRVVRVLEAKVI